MLKLLLVLLPLTAFAKQQMTNEVAFYIDTYGEIIPEQDAQVARTHGIFERLSAVADKSSKRMPKLVVVNSLNDSDFQFRK